MIWLAIVAALFATAAHAQQTPFAPVILDETGFRALIQSLADLRYRDAAPIIEGLVQLEQRAQAKAKADAEEKK